MTVEQVREMLLWSAIINYGFVILWAGLYLLARGLLNRVAHWWRLTPEQFDAFQFGGILLYKMGIWMFFIIPSTCLSGRLRRRANRRLSQRQIAHRPPVRCFGRPRI